MIETGSESHQENNLWTQSQQDATSLKLLQNQSVGRTYRIRMPGKANLHLKSVDEGTLVKCSDF